MGTLTKSTQRQSSHSVSMPPASRPIAPPPAETPANTPNARLRSGPSWKVVVISASEVGEAIAPPTPCRARAASSCHGLLGESAEQRGEGEQQDAEDEDPAAAEDVAGPAAEQQQAAEGERVGVDAPRTGSVVEKSSALWMCGQRDVHDRGVENHHELAGGDDDEGERGACLRRAAPGVWWSRD